MCSPGVTAREEVLAGLAALGPGADAVSLLGQVRDLAGFIDRAQGQLARLAAAVDAVDGASEAGYSSTAAFLRHGCGRAAGRAGELVATGRALRSLAATEKALMAGEISFDAAHVICRSAAQIPDAGMAQIAEEQMLAFARKPAPDPAGPGAQPDADAGADGGQPDPDAQPGGGGQTDGGQTDGPDGPDRPRTARSRPRTVPARTAASQTAPVRTGPPVSLAVPGGRRRRWTRASCAAWVRSCSTARTPAGSRSGSGNGSSGGTCRSVSPSMTAAP